MNVPTAPTATRRPAPMGAAVTVLADVVAPVALYYGLRWAGVGIYPALIVGGLPPAVSVTVKAIRHRRIDGLATGVLTILVVSTGLSLIGGTPRFLLAKDAMVTAATSAWFVLSLRAKRPLTFRFTRPLLEGRKIFDPKTRRWAASTEKSWDDLWDGNPRFRRIWRVTTVIWGAALLLDAVLRVAMAYTLPLDLAPGLGGALWPATFIALQVITNVYFLRSHLWLILLDELNPPLTVNHALTVRATGPGRSGRWWWRWSGGGRRRRRP